MFWILIAIYFFYDDDDDDGDDDGDDDELLMKWDPHANWLSLTLYKQLILVRS